MPSTTRTWTCSSSRDDGARRPQQLHVGCVVGRDDDAPGLDAVGGGESLDGVRGLHDDRDAGQRAQHHAGRAQAIGLGGVRERRRVHDHGVQIRAGVVLLGDPVQVALDDRHRGGAVLRVGVLKLGDRRLDRIERRRERGDDREAHHEEAIAIRMVDRDAGDVMTSAKRIAADCAAGDRRRRWMRSARARTTRRARDRARAQARAGGERSPAGDRPARARTRDLQPMRGFGFFLTTTTS